MSGFAILGVAEQCWDRIPCVRLGDLWCCSPAPGALQVTGCTPGDIAGLVPRAAGCDSVLVSLLQDSSAQGMRVCTGEGMCKQPGSLGASSMSLP